jgi:hypothetical protein
MGRTISALPALTMSIQSSKIALGTTSDSEEVGKVTSTTLGPANRVTGCDRWQNCGRRFDSAHQCRIEVAADESTNVTASDQKCPCAAGVFLALPGLVGGVRQEDKTKTYYRNGWRLLKTIISDEFRSRRPAPLRVTLYSAAYNNALPSCRTPAMPWWLT